MTRTARPTFLVDMDGVLADFDLRFHEVCVEKGWEWDCEGAHVQRHRFGTDHIIDRRHRKLARTHVNRTRWFLDLPVIEGAIEGMNELAEHGNVWIATKPLEANYTCRDDKAAWVRRHMGEEWERRMFITPDKSVLNGTLLLDDAHKPDWCKRASWSPVVFARSWNGAGSKWEGWPRWTWGDGVETLLDRARESAEYRRMTGRSILREA